MPQHNLNTNDTIYDDIDEILAAPPSKLVLYGNAVFLLVLMILFAISCFVSYTDGIACNASVVSVNAETINAPGIKTVVKKILVKTGAIVNKDAGLLIIQSLADGHTDTIKALQQGIITAQRRLLLNEVLEPGAALYIVSEKNNAYKIKISLPFGTDRLKVNMGQKVIVSINGFSRYDYGELNAEIISTPYTSPNGYGLTVDATCITTGKNALKQTIPAFTTAEGKAFIITQKKNLISKLF